MNESAIDWKRTVSYLEAIEKGYTDIGSNGRLALIISVNPLRDRYNNGERTQELHDDIMALE